MMHGRAGAYSLSANGKYDAATLSQRHQKWGHLWAQQGYLAMLVDGFGPRGYPHGFPRFSYQDRPESLDEVTVRPLDFTRRSCRSFATKSITCSLRASPSPIDLLLRTASSYHDSLRPR